MIITRPLEWAHALTPFNQPLKYLVLHHEAGNGTVEQIHAYHKSKGWAGIGYHLYVRKNGTIYTGRPMNMQGGHCSGYNAISIGICFEGNFENDRMGDVQKNAGVEAIEYALDKYPQLRVLGHRDLVATACPGHYFPLDYYKEIGSDYMTGEQIYEKLNDYLLTQPLPEWAKGELEEAKDMGITDGTRPMVLVPRYQAAILAKRAVEKARK